MRRDGTYRTLTRSGGRDVIALAAFGGELGDPLAAVVRVDGRVVLEVLAPVARRSWDRQTGEQFRGEVRRLAAGHGLLGRAGAVTVLFDPLDHGADDGSWPAGEPVARP